MVDKDPNDFNRRAGIRVRQLREAAGVSQRDLVDRLGLGISFSQAQLSRLERGRRVLRLDEAAAFAKALSVDLGALLADADDVELAGIEDQRRSAQAAIAERQKVIIDAQQEIADAERGIRYYETVIENLDGRIARIDERKTA
jgi:transcriptional regulator with XRE-family HTH domain